MTGRSPCREHHCHLCCLRTRMTLTEADVERLRSVGARRFFRRNRDGVPQLVNRDGHCFFLVDGKCSIYEHRPEGCRLYPLILDLDLDEAVRDDFCPWRDEFRFRSEDEARLRASVAAEVREASRRRRGRR